MSFLDIQHTNYKYIPPRSASPSAILLACVVVHRSNRTSCCVILTGFQPKHHLCQPILIIRIITMFQIRLRDYPPFSLQFGFASSQPLVNIPHHPAAMQSRAYTQNQRPRLLNCLCCVPGRHKPLRGICYLPCAE